MYSTTSTIARPATTATMYGRAACAAAKTLGIFTETIQYRKIGMSTYAA